MIKCVNENEFVYGINKYMYIVHMYMSYLYVHTHSHRRRLMKPKQTLVEWFMCLLLCRNDYMFVYGKRSSSAVPFFYVYRRFSHVHEILFVISKHAKNHVFNQPLKLCEFTLYSDGFKYQETWFWKPLIKIITRINISICTTWTK